MTNQYRVAFDQLGQAYKPKHRYECSETTTHGSIGRMLCANGVSQFKIYCFECNGRSVASLPHDYVAKLDQSLIPLIYDKRDKPCEHCGSTQGSELHHWAPKHLFPVDAGSWPKSWLCRKCHILWHSVVTPEMGNKSKGPVPAWAALVK